jgi:hypothetical protein
MGRVASGITWFDDDEYIGTEVSFEEPDYSTWKLEKKVSENEYYETEKDVMAGCAFSEARAVFFCSTEIKGFPKEAVIKIRMQYAPLPPTRSISMSSMSNLIAGYPGDLRRQNLPMSERSRLRRILRVGQSEKLKHSSA